MNYYELNKREKQILSIVYRLGEASVRDVVDRIGDAPSYNAIRVMMYLLENKGFLAHRQDGVRYIFRATEAKSEAGSTALDHLLKTFFEGSVPKLVNALMSSGAKQLSDDELNELAKLIESRKKDHSNSSQ
jgi:BlaI family penicillinase repressor